MRPSGDGDRENSRQDFFICEYGDRWPFACGGGRFPFLKGSDFLICVLGVSPLNRRRFELLKEPLGWLFVVRTGDLERVRARCSRLESEPEPEPSFSSEIGSGDLWRTDLAAERVTGAK